MAHSTISPGENRVDLHAHSTASDGTLSPTEIVQLARDSNLRAVALTDHDTVAGVPEALEAGKRLGVEVLPGIEISADYEDTGAHILGYLVDPASPALQEVIDWFVAERETRNQAIVDKLAADGFPISLPELKAKFPHTMLGRPHIGQLLVEKGCVGSVTEAMDRWLWDGQPYYVARQHLPGLRRDLPRGGKSPQTERDLRPVRQGADHPQGRQAGDRQGPAGHLPQGDRTPEGLL